MVREPGHRPPSRPDRARPGPGPMTGSGRGHPLGDKDRCMALAATDRRTGYPFTAVVGLDDLRLALVLSAVSPSVGGVLVRGEKGTAKSTMVRALAALLPPVAVVDGCRFSCDPAAPDPLCPAAPPPSRPPPPRRRANPAPPPPPSPLPFPPPRLAGRPG